MSEKVSRFVGELLEGEWAAAEEKDLLEIREALLRKNKGQQKFFSEIAVAGVAVITFITLRLIKALTEKGAPY